MNEKNELADAKIDIGLDIYEAAIFDMDGVVTETARAHAAAWNRIFFWKRPDSSTSVRKRPWLSKMPFRVSRPGKGAVSGW